MRREFSSKVRVEAFARSQGRCEKCTVKIALGNGPEYDHSTPDAVGGGATLDNCMVLCVRCHRAKTSKTDVPAIAKTARIFKKSIKAERKGKPMDGSRKSIWKNKINGETVRRT